MKTTAGGAMTALVLSVSVFAAGFTGFTIKTLDGQTLTEVRTMKRIVPGEDSVRLQYSDGIIDMPLANLSVEDKKLLGIQYWLDTYKQRADEHQAHEKEWQAEELARRHLAEKLNPADYPPELRTSIGRYNFNAELANKDSIAAAPDAHQALELLDPAAPKAEFEKVQQTFEQAGAQFPGQDKQALKSKAGNERHRLWKDLEALDNYKARIAGTENEAKIRNSVANDETCLGMPDFAVRVIEGEPHGRDGAGARADWKYVNAEGFTDHYYFEDGKLVEVRIH